jgi:hypothetical protein
LALVFRNSCDEHLLDSYSPERSAVGDEVLKSAAMLTTVGTMKNPVAQTLRNLVGHIMLGLSPVQHALADTMTEVTIGYPKSPLNGPCLAGAGPKPGQRVGPLSGQVPVGAGSAPRFALFAANTTATADLAGRFCWIATFAHLSAMAAFGWFDLTAISLVRPVIRSLSPIT